MTGPQKESGHDWTPEGTKKEWTRGRTDTLRLTPSRIASSLGKNLAPPNTLALRCARSGKTWLRLTPSHFASLAREQPVGPGSPY